MPLKEHKEEERREAKKLGIKPVGYITSLEPKSMGEKWSGRWKVSNNRVEKSERAQQNEESDDTKNEEDQHQRLLWCRMPKQ